ncbi:MAG: helix-turn-helix transcriptional regulator [Oscillospiraceae bacterium]|nr:helix-turn-helix transcriptional regulator [Oscillospiraceae bacterium]
MPSQTFYNLSSAKQEMLLAAARAEFARVPFREASINQIVRAAHISRGSFYMFLYVFPRQGRTVVLPDERYLFCGAAHRGKAAGGERRRPVFRPGGFV